MPLLSEGVGPEKEGGITMFPLLEDRGEVSMGSKSHRAKGKAVARLQSDRWVCGFCFRGDHRRCLVRVVSGDGTKEWCRCYSCRGGER